MCSLYNAGARTCALSATMRQRSSSQLHSLKLIQLDMPYFRQACAAACVPDFWGYLGIAQRLANKLVPGNQLGSLAPRFLYLKCPCSCLWQEAVDASADPSPKCTYAHWQVVF